MSRDAVKNWISSVLTASASPASGSYPRGAYEGILYGIGFPSSVATIYKDRPVRSMDIKTRLAVVVNVVGGKETTKTSGGAYGQRIRTVNVEIDLFWVADFGGNPITGTPPEYTDQDVAARKFDNLIDGVMNTFALAFFQAEGPSTLVGRGWPLTDTTTGFKSILQAMMPDFEHMVNSPELAENQIDVFYAAQINFELIELYNSLGT